MKALRASGVALVAVGAIALAGCAGGGDDGGSTEAPSGQELTLLFGSSGDPETESLTEAANAWADETGNTVDVVAASDLTQQLAQGFAGGDEPDLFYMSWDQFQTYAGENYLEPYAGDLSNAGDYYQSLVDTFTYDGEFVCAPKDFSTLSLVINTAMWEDAGLTDDDIPTDWDGLEQVAGELTTGDTVGLSMSLEYARIGVFMNQAGGALVSEDGATATADSPENLEGLEFVQGLHDDGSLQFAPELDAGWGGEAFGTEKAAMTIEGPWINGALAADYPDVEYTAVELPAGPGGSSTFTFTNCWGIPEGSDTADAATSLVEFLTTPEQQLAFADAFGPIPSIESAAQQYADENPEIAAYVAGNDYAVSPVNFDGSASVVTEFNAQLEGLTTGADVSEILASLQTNLQAALDEANG